MDEARFRLRVTYRKSGMLRFLSHLETARACERAVRRAGLPYAVTRGFNPHMRIAFGPALPVGTAGLSEMYDVWLTQHVPAVAACERLSRVSPEHLQPVSARYVDPKAPSLAAAADVAHYEVVVRGPEGVGEATVRGLARIVASGILSVEHKGKQKVFELAEALLKEPTVRPVDGGALVEIATRLSEKGSLRPDALVKAALGPEADAGVSLRVTRVRLASSAAEGMEATL